MDRLGERCEMMMIESFGLADKQNESAIEFDAIAHSERSLAEAALSTMDIIIYGNDLSSLN